MYLVLREILYICISQVLFMTTLQVNISNKAQAKRVAQYLRKLEYVDAVSLVEKIKPLADDEWIVPGRPATEAEMEKFFDAMDKQANKGISSANLKKKIAKWKKGKYE